MIKRLFRFLRMLPPSRALSRYSKRVMIPAFEGHSLYEIAVFFGRGLGRGGLKTRASSMAYNFFLAIFPAIIFLFTLLPYVPIEHFQDQLFETIRGIMPQNAFLTIEDTVLQILHNQNSKLLSFGFVAALYFATNGLSAMMVAFNKSIHVREERPVWKQQLIAVALTIFLAVVLIIGISIIIGSEIFIDRMMKAGATETWMLWAGRWLVVGFLFMLIIAVYYRFGPSQRMHRRLFSPGVLLATALIIITSIGFAWYVNNFGKYNKLYGSIGSVIVMLIWIYYNSMMLLIGFELDAAISGAKENRRTLLEQEEAEVKLEEEQI
jgi:membrane protein